MKKAVGSPPHNAKPRAPKVRDGGDVVRESTSEVFSELVRRLKGQAAIALGGQSPWPALQAWEEWGAHLALSPDRQAELWSQVSAAILRFWRTGFKDGERADWCFQPTPDDRRFRDPAWSKPPFAVFAQAQLAAETLWRAATVDVPGVSERYARRVEFLGRFGLNAFAPINFALTNPSVLDAAWRTGGMNFAAGAARFAEDFAKLARGAALQPCGEFKVGETIAITPGEVVFRNELIELIQYRPTTATVRPEPILIVPAWMMKYYILDLSPANSLVRYLVDQGFTVFMISWKNPGAELRDAGFEDYRRRGVAAAIEVVGRIVPDEKIHAVGYCLGGTLLAIAAAAMGRDGDDRLASVSLFATQTDFTEVGDLMLFVDESQLAVLQDLMHLRGFLDTRLLGGAFSMLRAEEMMFARLVERYLLGEVNAPSDMTAWLSDPTRMPERVHGEYLRKLVLDNDFAQGRHMADGAPVSPQDIRPPMFVLGAERDHVAPWHSVYGVKAFGSADTTFALAEGDHHSGVVCPPDRPDAYYRLSSGQQCEAFDNPDAWREAAAQKAGSWWPEWALWLEQRSSPRRKPPPLGRAAAGLKPLGPAPGVYVLET